MKVRLTRMSIYGDGKRIGWFMFSSPHLLYARILGQKVRAVINVDRGIFFLIGTSVVAGLIDDRLDYSGEIYTIGKSGEEGKEMPSMIRQRDGKAIAISTGEKSMDYVGENDPVLMACSALVLCIAERTELEGREDNHVMQMFGGEIGKKRGSWLFWVPFIAGFSMPILYLLSNRITSPLGMNLLIAGYAALIISIILYTIYRTVFHRVRIFLRV